MAPALDTLLESTSSAKSIVALSQIISGLIHNIKETNQNCTRKRQALLDKITELRQEHASLERTIIVHEATIADLKAKISIADTERSDLSNKLANTTSELVPEIGPENQELQSLKDSLDDTNQYARRGAFTLSGKDNEIPIFSEDENSKAIVIDKILMHTGVRLNETDISIAHRLGRKPESPDSDRRGIRFRLVRRDLGPRIVAACKEKRPPVFVNPSITPLRAKIFHELRKLKSDHQIIKSCRATLNGDIEAYCSNSDGNSRNFANLKRHVINTKKQLQKFATDTLQIPASSIFIPTASRSTGHPPAPSSGDSHSQASD